MKKSFLLLSIFAGASVCMAQSNNFDIESMADFAQESYSTKVVSNSSLSIGVIPALEYSYEDALSDKSSLIFRVGFPSHMRWEMHTDSMGTEINGLYDSAVGITLEPRYYLGLTERSRRGKNTFLNSSNYISLVSSITMADYGRIDIRAVPVIGMRRALGSGWMFELYGGLGAGIEEMNRLYLCPSLQLRIGYCFQVLGF